MAVNGGGGHWIDRLAVRATRRESLKAALAGAMLTMPFVGAQRAAAANPNGAGDPHACQKGCTYTAHTQYVKTVQGCADAAGPAAVTFGAASFFVSPIFTVLAVENAVRRVRCEDDALLQQKATSFDCLQPDCPGFNPNAPGGPCESCFQSGGVCCPFAPSPTGYGCCIADANICCDPVNLCRTC